MSDTKVSVFIASTKIMTVMIIGFGGKCEINSHCYGLFMWDVKFYFVGCPGVI